MTTFFDTNIFVYAFLENEKQRRAQEVLADGGIISVQVLNEFANVAHKKRKRPWTDVEAALQVIQLRFPDVLSLTKQTHLGAIKLAKADSLSIYDALIITSAREAGCDKLYSEDLQHGRTFGKLQIVNPFL